MTQFVEDHGHHERHAEPEHQGDAAELGRVPPRVHELRIAEQAAEVAPPHPVRRTDEVRVLEGQQERTDRRVPREQREAEHATGEQRVRGQVGAQFPTPTTRGPAAAGRSYLRPDSQRGRDSHGPQTLSSTTDWRVLVNYWLASNELTLLAASDRSWSTLAPWLVRTADITLSSTE